MYVKYLYNSHLKDEQFLIGAKITFEEETGIRTQEIYVGTFYTMEEFLAVKETLGIKSSEEFIRKVFAQDAAAGIVYFPNIGKFGFLESGDITVGSIDELNSKISSYFDEENKSRKRKKEYF